MQKTFINKSAGQIKSVGTSFKKIYLSDVIFQFL